MKTKHIFAMAGGIGLLLGALPAVHAQATDQNAPAAQTPTTTDNGAVTPITPPTTPPPDTATATQPPPEQPTVTHSSPRFRIGPAIGIYFPTSGKTRNRFGNTWYSIGVGIGAINGVSTKGTLGIDANLFYHNRDSAYAFFLPIGVGYRVALAPSSSKEVPYVGVSVDADFTDINSKQDNVNHSFSVGGGGTAFVGVNFGDSAFIEARYLELSHANGFDLSGLNLSAGYRF